ncbi:hypothetical protein B0H63DRAFT_496225 [Podospora didyma]|uniref:glutamate--tRNA ligase n=1 Tax=Podospora didyma TaxID=330526 RepID=A0AAE0KDY8_9PEZI|nr:hypothetical protein B0H63DRAFT_496225 [Podospora didyma]
MEALATGLGGSDYKSVESFFLKLERLLALRTYIGGFELSDWDTKAWTITRTNKVAHAIVRKGDFKNVARWFGYIEAVYPEIQVDVKAAQDHEKEKRAAASRAGASYNIGLKDTENGVVTRLPPEPSGYLHIGHAKAAFLDDYFAHDAFKGKLIVRFDDTNPTKEKQEPEDDYFQQLYDISEQMIRDGNAYIDDTDPDTSKEYRRNRLPNPRRNRSPEESVAIHHCIRAKMLFDSLNGTMRDPAIYRFPNFQDNKPQPHHRTGWTWNIYPTYDYVCPVIDSLEGYCWFQDALRLRRVHLWEYARLCFIRTFLSKRKLTKIVESGKVARWDDPRMPTIRGILRRGLTVPALRGFMLKQGPSRSLVVMDWTILWSMKKAIDPVTPRHTAVEKNNIVIANIVGGPETPYTEEKPKYPKNPAVGTKSVTFSSTILIDQADAASFTLGEEITLMAWGNAIVRKIEKAPDGTVTGIQLELYLDGDFRKTEKKITWLSAGGSDLINVELWDFDYLLTKDNLGKDDSLDDYLNPATAVMAEALCDANMVSVKENGIIQLERKGYFWVDKATGQGREGKAVLFKTPAGGKD